MLVKPVSPVSSGSRRERLRTMMRQEILDAARKIVQEQGFKDLSMRALGRAVGVTAPTLYDYFPSKDAVLDALYVEGVRGLRGEFDTVAATDATAAQKLSRIAHAYRVFAQKQPDLFMLVFGRVDANYRPSEEGRFDCMSLMEPIQRIVVDAISSGEVRPCEPHAAVHFLWTTVHGFVMLEVNQVLDKCPPDELDQLFETNLNMLAEGLRPIAPSGAVVDTDPIIR